MCGHEAPTQVNCGRGEQENQLISGDGGGVSQSGWTSLGAGVLGGTWWLTKDPEGRGDSLGAEPGACRDAPSLF